MRYALTLLAVISLTGCSALTSQLDPAAAKQNLANVTEITAQNAELLGASAIPQSAKDAYALRNAAAVDLAKAMAESTGAAQ